MSSSAFSQGVKDSIVLEGREYVRVPSKSSLCDPERMECRWVLEYGDGKLVPEDVLFDYGILKRVGKKTYALKDVVDKLRVYGIYNAGSRRYPIYVVDQVCYADGRCDSNLESKELYEKYRRYYSLWMDALKTAVYSKVSLPDTPSVQRDSRNWSISYGSISIRYSDRGRYRVVNIYTDKNKPLRDFIEAKISGILSKYGFEKGRYGGYIARGKVSVDELINEIAGMLKSYKGIIEDLINKKKYEEYIALKKSIEDARRELGLPIVNAEKIVWSEHVVDAVTGVATEKREEVGGELPSLEEALAGWVSPPTAVAPVAPTAVKTEEEKEEEQLEKIREAVERITPEDIARAMAEQGYKLVKMIVFDLPTEFKYAETVYSREGGRYVEKKIFSVDPAKYRTLRKKFYNILHRIAYRTPGGWIMFENIDRNDLDRLNEVIKALNELAGTRRTAWIIETYMPRTVLVEWLKTYIAQRRANLEEIKRKLEENIEKKTLAKRLQRQFNQLVEELHKLEQELKYL